MAFATAETWISTFFQSTSSESEPLTELVFTSSELRRNLRVAWKLRWAQFTGHDFPVRILHCNILLMWHEFHTRADKRIK